MFNISITAVTTYTAGKRQQSFVLICILMPARYHSITTFKRFGDNFIFCFALSNSIFSQAFCFSFAVKSAHGDRSRKKQLSCVKCDELEPN